MEYKIEGGTLPVLKCKLKKGEYLYCEAVDQYIFGFKVTHIDLYDITEMVSYADYNNEIEDVTCVIIKIHNLTMAQSKLLPDWDTLISAYPHLSYTQVGIVNQTKIYKDPREKLTFSIKIERSN